MITLSHVCKSYDKGKLVVVNDVSLQINKGETLVLLGSSGSGKTTILKMINRLIEPTAGNIEIDGVNIKEIPTVKLRHQIGYVFQQVGLFPHMTIEKNVWITLQLMGVPLNERRERAHQLLQLVNLNPDKYAKRYPDELSGGQQQRIGVARALAANPDYMLMDEPFGALDAISRDSLQVETIKLKEHLKKTIVFVTHDIAEAFRLADRIAVLHQGQCQQVGTKEEIINNPATEFVRNLIDAQNLSFESSQDY